MAIIRAPQNAWTTKPERMLAYLAYMNRAGLVSATASSESELFFPDQSAGAPKEANR